MKPFRRFVQVASLLLIAQAAHAQTSSVELYWSAGVGWLQPLEDLRFVAVRDPTINSQFSSTELSGAPLLSLSLDLETSTFVDLRGTLSSAWPSAIQFQETERGSTAVLGASLHVLVRPWKARTLRPYAAVGGGVRHYRFGIDSDDPDLCSIFCSSRTYPSAEAAVGLDSELSGTRVFAEATLFVNRFDRDIEEIVLSDGEIFRFQPGRIQRDLGMRFGVAFPL